MLFSLRESPTVYFLTTHPKKYKKGVNSLKWKYKNNLANLVSGSTYLYWLMSNIKFEMKNIYSI